MSSAFTADYRGARGSNAGDEFHELWALDQALALLEARNGLTAVTVEGIPATQQTDADGPHWDGVDCGLFFGGESFETAKRVEFVQLKYSGTPNEAWSLTRLVKSTAKKGNNSVLRKLADDFRAARSLMRPAADLWLRLVSNQAVDQRVIDAFHVIAAASTDKAQIDQQGDINRISKATGLKGQSLREFAASLDFSGCGSASRFSVREKVILEVARLVEDAADLDVPHLRQNVRNLMLPERHDEYITRSIVLAWFNIADEAGLFPCPSRIMPVERPIAREPTADLADSLVRGARIVCLHGPAGCGKTTSLQLLPSLLPHGSCFVLFDSYGGGSYLFADDRRHLPENAFLQIANDLARELGTPLFLARDRRRSIDVRAFLRRVAIAANVVAAADPEGLLVLAIDAADNAVTAAVRVAGNEPCFVHELTTANLEALPQNVRIVVSSRTARVDTLHLPRSTPRILCPPFSPAETASYVRQLSSEATDEWIEQFHYLSSGIPRVQHYAVESVRGNLAAALDSLRPGGKRLDDVLRAQFDAASSRLGDPDLLGRLTASLAIMPPPIPTRHLAAISGTTVATVEDLVSDLSPGLRAEPDGISIADEDLEEFIEREAEPHVASTRHRMAEHFREHSLDDAYAATHLGDALVNAGLETEILRLIETDTTLTAIADPVVRREVLLRRLHLALRVCRGTGNVVETLKVILISAEANQEESALREVLESQVDLAVHFAWPTLRRLVLADRSSAEKQGSVLAQDAARATHAGDRLTVRERLASHNTWLRRRNGVPAQRRRQWPVTANDLVARAEASLAIGGAEAMVAEVRGWRPRTATLETSLRLVPALIAAGREQSLAEVLQGQFVPAPWDLLVSIPFALAGRAPDATALAHSLQRVNRRHVPRGGDLALSMGPDAWQQQWFELLLVGCELAVRLGVERPIVLRVTQILRAVLEPELRLALPVAIDGLLRIWLLEKQLGSTDSSLGELLGLVQSSQQQEDADSRRDARSGEDAQRRSELSEAVRALFPIYQARTSLLASGGDGPTSGDSFISQIPGLESRYYGFDRSFRLGDLRSRVARSLMHLMLLPGVSPNALLERATGILMGRFATGLGTSIIPLLEYLLLRPDAHRLVVDTVTERTMAVREARYASSEKVSSLLSFSRLLLRVSPDDAKALFASAVDLTREMDREAFDQIELLSSLTASAPSASPESRARIAAEVFRFVSGAAERLSPYDGFPWEASALALARLSVPVGLAAIARWSDAGVSDLQTTLPPFLRETLRLGRMSPDVVTALAILLEAPDDGVVAGILEANKGTSLPPIAELARDCLLHAPQAARLALARRILAAVDAGTLAASSLLQELRATAEFLERLPADHGTDGASGQEQPVAELDIRKADALAGGKFTSVDAISRALDILKTAGYYRQGEALIEMARRTAVADRARYLDALADLEPSSVWEPERARAIAWALTEWSGTPAIEQWRSQRLPAVIVGRFSGLARGIKELYSGLPDLLQAMRGAPDRRLDVVMQGIESSGMLLGSRALYGVAEIIVRDLSAQSSASLLTWYTERLGRRLPIDRRAIIDPSSMPDSVTEATGRFLFALLGDIDTRIRWRTAHALRRLARLGARDTIQAVMANWDRTEDSNFRDPDAPYYWLASRLWLAIAMDRIAGETPAAIAPQMDILVRVATDALLPHLLIREYSKRAILRLAGAGHTADGLQLEALSRVNEPRLPQARSRRRLVSSRTRLQGTERAFQFDTMDTVRYWYEPVVGFFPRLSMDQFLGKAERWILGEWKARPNANWWEPEPRKARYDEREASLWFHDHGGLPTVERYGAYLEFHAMMCVVGELLETHALAKPDDGFLSFEEWLAQFVPTESESWISDLRDATPLSLRFWSQDPGRDDEWLERLSVDEFTRELGIGRDGRRGWIVVGGHHTTQFPTRRVESSVWSALVSPDTAPSLVRALQTAVNPWDFRIPWQDDELEIDEEPYRLVGWLEDRSVDLKFDRSDPLRNEARPPQRLPGRLVTRTFSLTRAPGPQLAWISSGVKHPRLVAEVWSDLPERDDTRPRPIGSNGWRLWMRRDDLRTFLIDQHMDLLYEVQVERRIYDAYARSYEPDRQEKTRLLHQILLCRRDGQLETASGRLSSWTTARRGASA